MAVRLSPEEMRTNAEKIMDERVKARVLRGVEILTDRLGPDWVDHIDVLDLDLGSGTACVLGQVFGNAPVDEAAVERYAGRWGYGTDDDPEFVWSQLSGYDRGRAVLNADVIDCPEAYGFDADVESYDNLTDAWEMVFGPPPVAQP